MFKDVPILFLFDLDSTLIQQETIDELAKLQGKYDECAEITEKTMRGEFDFEQAMRARIKLLKGLNAEFAWSKIFGNLKITPGAKDLFNFIKTKNPNNKIFIASSGFMPIAAHVKELLGADECFANDLQVDSGGCFTGELVAEKIFIDAEYKKKILLNHSRGFQISVAVGDGSNDIPMLKTATISIATFNAKLIVKEAAKYTAPELDMLSIIPFVYPVGDLSFETHLR
jgi:phosphoserine phosphatase